MLESWFQLNQSDPDAQALLYSDITCTIVITGKGEREATFAFIPYFCNPTNVLELWNKFSIDISIDYFRNNIEATSLNLALHDINATLEQHGLSCTSIDLPVPTENAIEVQTYNQDDEREEAEQRISSLNRGRLSGRTAGRLRDDYQSYWEQQ
ncbi:hypothetical protein AVEN_144328-1 [Araneus ventricosus]|uniref:Uncharacterized protein n=1 Tax=Araneus ventricosus TaxID=182803 RepID=A0A4Y2K6A2_ARAVE|nr:hypothetical protein AVEN_144328-1 [Araneus ventricosus]